MPLVPPPAFCPDLILLDIGLPDISGYETCRQLRSNGHLRHAKLVLVSGNSQVEDRLKGYEVGADDFISKPYVPDELVAKVRVLLRLKRTEELSGLKDDILTLLAHETRTPLTVINGAVDAMRSTKTNDTDPAGEFLSMIADAAARLGALMERSHLLCTLKSGGLLLNKVPVNMTAFLTSAVDAMREKALAHDVRIVVECPDQTEIIADDGLLRIAVSSVLDNAIRFSPRGTTTHVEVSTTANQLCIAIVDEGPGFDPEVMSHLFEELSAHDMAHHHEGARLGLSITREIVALHGGSIDIVANAGAGCTVSITLPRMRSTVDVPLSA